MIEENIEKLEERVRTLDRAGKNSSLKIIIYKNKTMVFGCRHIERHIKIDNRKLENVEKFVYLGSVLTWDNDCTKYVRARIAKAKSIMAGFNNIWSSKQISYKTKKQYHKSMCIQCRFVCL